MSAALRLCHRVIRGFTASRFHVDRISPSMIGILPTRYPSPSKHPRLYTNDAKTATTESSAMFCFQCEQTKSRKGCSAVGVCGKTHETAAMQDLLVYAIKGLSVYADRVVKLGGQVPRDIGQFSFSALFSTLTNVNFDASRFPTYIINAIKYRDEMKKAYEEACSKNGSTPEFFSDGPAAFQLDGESQSVLEHQGKSLGVLRGKEIYGDDVNGVREMITYGLKGMVTYAQHASRLGKEDPDVANFVYEAFSFMESGPESERHDVVTNLGWALRVGEMNIRVLDLLDTGHKERFGSPIPTSVNSVPLPGKAILVSGHDMHDLQMILDATKDTDINVYTHGEMLPAHGYPTLKAYKNLAGQFGGPWQLQKIDFGAFPGAVAVTTNCLVEPLKSYRHRIFTLNDTGFHGIQHLDLHNSSDMNLLIDAALSEKGFTEEDGKVTKPKNFTVGFGHEAILANADKIIEAITTGELQRVFVVGGCDGAEHKRNYFTHLVENLPKETLILTMGCAKYRFNAMELGTLGTTGLPRLMDMGQCNDSYGAVKVAMALAEALNTDINSLPLSITLSWFEQKAVAVLLSLLHLGIQNIRLGPVLPAFVTPNVLAILVDKFKLTPTDTRHPLDDIKLMMQQN